MSRAGRPTKRLKREKASLSPTMTVVEFVKNRLMNPDKRSHAEFLWEMRDKQAAGKLANPDTTAPLLDRLERAVASQKQERRRPSRIRHRAGSASPTRLIPAAAGTPEVQPQLLEEQLMAYAAAADVQAILGRELDTAETALVERRLAQVERMILRRIPDLADQITAEEIDPDDVRDIEAEAVYRVIRNPEGLRSENDGQYGYQLSAEVADNTLRILPEEWKILGVKPSRMFSIGPVSAPGTDGWCRCEPPQPWDRGAHGLPRRTGDRF